MELQHKFCSPVDISADSACMILAHIPHACRIVVQLLQADSAVSLERCQTIGLQNNLTIWSFISLPLPQQAFASLLKSLTLGFAWHWKPKAGSSKAGLPSGGVPRRVHCCFTPHCSFCFEICHIPGCHQCGAEVDKTHSTIWKPE